MGCIPNKSLQDIIVEKEIKISDFKRLPTNEVKDIKAIEAG